ncbi:class I SAM-dependent methyltransferase [Luminiphilus sp.]|nr:class I SAM-dependent methyltransferase [Luminiphilus sp.]
MSELNIELEKLGIIDQERLEIFYPRVRDRDDVAVLKDPITEVIVLSRCDHVSESYYTSRKEKNIYNVHGKNVTAPRLEDNIRRTVEFGSHIRGKNWLDFGCGLGGMLDELAAEAAWAAGLEPNLERATIVAGKGHKVVTNLDDVSDGSIDIITMFHVLEHLTNPVQTLASLRRVLSPRGRLLIEVPHARDALFALYDCDAFKRFTFWSEHLVLHTRQSLAILLKAAGYPETQIIGYQRYPLSNHLYWLSKGVPGGHQIWPMLSSTGLEMSYSASLAALDGTDTLVLVTT